MKPRRFRPYRDAVLLAVEKAEGVAVREKFKK